MTTYALPPSEAGTIPIAAGTTQSGIVLNRKNASAEAPLFVVTNNLGTSVEQPIETSAVFEDGKATLSVTVGATCAVGDYLLLAVRNGVAQSAMKLTVTAGAVPPEADAFAAPENLPAPTLVEG